ncbi:MAG: VOC family protein [Candidatus Acidiferrales bacterium]
MPRSTVIPELPYADVIEATKWLCNAFGFTSRIGMGSHRAQLNVGDGAVVLTEQSAADADRAHRSVMVRVDDVDRHYDRAVKFGVRILRPPKNYPYGERQYNAEDFAGHHWTFSQSIADVDPEEWGGVPGQI